jgi:hypothetical protein
VRTEHRFAVDGQAAGQLLVFAELAAGTFDLGADRTVRVKPARRPRVWVFDLLRFDNAVARRAVDEVVRLFPAGYGLVLKSQPALRKVLLEDDFGVRLLSLDGCRHDVILA